MPDQMEILLEEVAILRQEIALIHATLDKSEESLRNLNAALLQRLDALAVLVRGIESRPPLLPQ